MFLSFTFSERLNDQSASERHGFASERPSSPREGPGDGTGGVDLRRTMMDDGRRTALGRDYVNLGHFGRVCASVLKGPRAEQKQKSFTVPHFAQQNA